jgi:hypothetical protein
MRTDRKLKLKLCSSTVTPGAAEPVQPIAVTVNTACYLGGFGPTTCWRLIADGTLQTVRVGRRRLVLYNSLVRLLTPDDSSTTPPRRRRRPRKAELQAQHTAPTPSPRRRGRPRKAAAQLQLEATAAT